MIFDTHVHFNSEKYKELNIDIKTLINEAKEQNIHYFAIPSFNYLSCLDALKLSQEYENTYAIIGIHPTDSDKTTDLQYDEIEKMLINSKVVAVGECGLDYYWDTDKLIQEKSFVKQIKWAIKHELPLVIHTRDALERTYEILKENNANLVGGVIHSFSGSLEMALKFINLNFKIGLSGPITFKNNKLAIPLIEGIALEHIVVETDAPYLTPHPFRGKVNAPKYVTYVVSKIAEIKNISYDEVVKITTNNAFELFGLEKENV